MLYFRECPPFSCGNGCGIVFSTSIRGLVTVWEIGTTRFVSGLVHGHCGDATSVWLSRCWDLQGVLLNGESSKAVQL